MFEIGNSLHEARVRHGFDFHTAETATKIRAKYLKALEEEQFDQLPSETYVRGFLRSYAAFLGLDGQLYVDEYNSRFVIGEEAARSLRPRRSDARPQRRSSRFESNVVLVTLAAIGLVAALVIVAWKSGGNGPVVPPKIGQPRAPAAAARAPATVHLVVTARRGNSLLEVHADSASGRLLFQGTLLRGKSVPLAGRRLWVSVGVPANVVATVNGRRVSLGRGAGQQVVVVTPAGVSRPPAS